MGPTAPSKRTTARSKVRARLAASSGPALPKTFRPNAVISDSFLNSKKDKHLIKHSSFVSRISKASAPSGNKKRRRPSKKLVTTLESLGDALDDIAGEMEETMMDKEQAAAGKVRHKSLKSRPGALKRKEKVVKGEMERFGRSLAQLAMVKGATPATVAGEGMEVEKDGEKKSEKEVATADRWAALRGFISSTMEQNPAFLVKKE